MHSICLDGYFLRWRHLRNILNVQINYCTKWTIWVLWSRTKQFHDELRFLLCNLNRSFRLLLHCMVYQQMLCSICKIWICSETWNALLWRKLLECICQRHFQAFPWELLRLGHVRNAKFLCLYHDGWRMELLLCNKRWRTLFNDHNHIQRISFVLPTHVLDNDSKTPRTTWSWSRWIPEYYYGRCQSTQLPCFHVHCLLPSETISYRNNSCSFDRLSNLPMLLPDGLFDNQLHIRLHRKSSWNQEREQNREFQRDMYLDMCSSLQHLPQIRRWGRIYR